MTDLQNLLNCKFDIDSNTSATIIITFIIFFSGILITELIKLLSRIRERRKFRLIINSSIKNVINQAKKQVVAYEKIAEEFNWKGNKHILLGRTILSKTQFDYKMIFTAYFTGIENISLLKKKKSKAINKIWEALQSLDFWHEKSFADVDKFLDKYSQYNNKRNEALDQHRKLIEMNLTSLSGNSLPTRLGHYVQQIDNLHVQWQAAENRTRPDILHDILVTPSLLLNRNYPEIELARKSSDLLLQASIEYESMESLLKVYNQQFLNYSRIFRYNYRTLEKAIRLI